MDTAQEIRERNQERAVTMKRADPEHSNCPGRPGWDPEMGVVCYCGVVLGYPADAEEEQEVLPASVTTADARQSAPLAVQPVEAQVVSESNLASAVDPADPILARLVVIDPTQPYDSKMVEEHLLDAVARLERGGHYERVCAEDYADKKLKYHMAHARARLRAKKECGGSEGDRDAWAAVECEAEFVDQMIAKMKLDAIKGTMHTLRSIVSAYQSIGRSIASAFSTYGGNNTGPRERNF